MKANPPLPPVFWQYPCKTEWAANQAHRCSTHFTDWFEYGFYQAKSNSHNPCNAPAVGSDLYVGLPWATFLDKKLLPHLPLELLRSRFHSLRMSAARSGTALRIHTVCQHIFWEQLLPCWQSLGVTDVHLSHWPESGLPNLKPTGLRFHPWHLYAVNVEEADRQQGLLIKPDVSTRQWLASFIGAHGSNYLSDIRKRLLTFANQPGFLVEVTGARWHFESVVYGEQVQGQRFEPSAENAASVRRYNEVLCDTQFALCPSGTGPNSLRFWEALALGCIPVLLGVRPALPDLPFWSEKVLGQVLAWEDIVLKVDDENLHALPQQLANISLAERQQRSEKARLAYQAIKQMRCFLEKPVAHT